MPLRQPGPVLATMDVIYGLLHDAKLLRDTSPGQASFQIAYFAHIVLGKFGIPSALPASVGAVDHSIRMIVSMCCPTEMHGIDTEKMTIAAIVRRFVLRRRRRAMDCIAGETRNKLHALVVPKLCSALGFTEGPSQTGIVSERQYNIAVKTEWCAIGLATQRIAVSLPLRIVRRTPSTAKGRLAAAGNRTYAGNSQFSLHERLIWREPVATQQRPAGSLFAP